MEKNNWIKTIGKVIPYLTWESLSPDFRTTWHVGRHNNITFELHIILQGSCGFEVEEHSFSLEAGQGIFIRPGAFHSASQVSNPFLRLSLPFFIKDTSLFPETFREDTPFYLFQTTPAIQKTCYEILEEHDTAGIAFNQEMLSVLFSQLWIQIFRSLVERIPQTEGIQKTVRSDIQNIDYFFSCFYTGKRTRQELARTLHCSERHVNRILLQLYGMNFRQMKQKAMLEQAKSLLRCTSKTISEICIQVGYTDETTFYKTFKADCGMTPQEYRRSCQTQISRQTTGGSHGKE